MQNKNQDQLGFLQALFSPTKQKKRNPIFSHTLKKFDDIYHIYIPEFQSYQKCQCSQSLQVCLKIKSIFQPNMQQHAQKVYELQKKKFEDKSAIIEFQIKEEILKPHMQNLIKVLQIEQSQYWPIYYILRHAKCQYLTFWIYGLISLKWPSEKQYLKNIKTLIKEKELDITLQPTGTESNSNEEKIKKCYEEKLSNFFQQHYIVFVRLFLQKNIVQKFAEKVVLCAIIKGRTRQEHQIIQAALKL